MRTIRCRIVGRNLEVNEILRRIANDLSASFVDGATRELAFIALASIKQCPMYWSCWSLGSRATKTGTTTSISTIGVFAIGRARRRRALSRVPATGVAYFDLPGLDTMASLISKRAWVDRMLVVETATGGISLDDLQAHGCDWYQIEDLIGSQMVLVDFSS